MKKVLIVSASPRVNSNSEALAKAFARGAQEAGDETELISLRGKTVNFCRGCFVCQEKLRCVIHDDADAICQKALNADVLVFATPIYYYEMSGQLKTLLDRLNPLFPSDYAFRDVYLLRAGKAGRNRLHGRCHSSRGKPGSSGTGSGVQNGKKLLKGQKRHLSQSMGSS